MKFTVRRFLGGLLLVFSLWNISKFNNFDSVGFENDLLLELDQTEAKIFNQMSSHSRSLDDHLNSLDDRLNSLDDRLNSLDDRLSSLDDRLNSLDDRLSSLDDRLNSLGVLGVLGGNSDVLDDEPCFYSRCHVVKTEIREFEIISKFNFRESCAMDRGAYWLCHPTYESLSIKRYQAYVSLMLGLVNQSIPVSQLEKSRSDATFRVGSDATFRVGSVVDCQIDHFGKISVPIIDVCFVF